MSRMIGTAGPAAAPGAPTRRGVGGLLAVGLAVGLVAGCRLRPDESEAGVRLRDAFREAGGLEGPRPDPAWWRGFGSEELDGFMARALAANLDLAGAAARVRQADAAVRIAGASLLPEVSAGSSGGRSRAAGGRAGRLPGSDRFAASLAADYELDLWGRIRNGVLAAELSARAERYAYVTVLLTTQASVANTYFTILQAREELRVQEANLAAARRVLGVIRSQVAAGTATGLDLAQQETVVAQQEAAVPPLRQVIAQNEAALATLVGTTLPELRVGEARLERLSVPAVGAGVPSELLGRRPDVLTAEADLRAADADVAVARAALFPTVTLSASTGFQSALLGTLLRPEAQVYSLLASLAQTVFDAGRRRAQVDLSRAQAEELLANYRLAILTALSDTETALNALRETTEQEVLLREAATRAERAAAIAEEQLRGGTINLITLLNTQTAVFTARRNLTRGRLERLQAAVGLFRNLGGGWGPGVGVAILPPSPRVNPGTEMVVPAGVTPSTEVRR